MADFHADIQEQLKKGRRVTFTREAGASNEYRCSLENQATGEAVAQGKGGNAYTAFFEATAIELWYEIWPDAPRPGQFPTDVQDAMNRGDTAYVKSRIPRRVDLKP